MKQLKNKTAIFLVFTLLFFVGNSSIKAQSSDEFVTISGVVHDQKSKKGIKYARIYIPQKNIGTVTNQDGEFILNINRSINARSIEISHVGYQNSSISLDKEELSGLSIGLQPNPNILEDIIIRARNPREIIEEAIKKIPQNYSPTSNILTGFYRETAQKGKRYINISEAIINIYKTSYKEEGVDNDRVRVIKGRKLLSQRANDTLVVKMLGGPNLAIYVDIVKNPEILLSRDQDELSIYSFSMEESTMINNRLHYVISFKPQTVLPYALYEGNLYIDSEQLSISRAEYNLIMEDQDKATQAILKKKPFGMLFRPLELSYQVTYKEVNGVSYLSHIDNTVRFQCDRKRKWFATNYSIKSEMAVTDWEQTQSKIPFNDSLRRDHFFSDKASNFDDKNFWGIYNIIQPTKTLEKAIEKLKKEQK